MNYNDKKNHNIEKDDMNIKSHLDASLDLSGISVSEDLINRTLEAIKKQTAEQSLESDDHLTAQKVASKDTKKVIPWNRYIRGFAGVAAAAVIVVAGYNILNNVSYKADKSSDSSFSEEMASNSVGTEDAEIDNSTMAALDGQESVNKAEDTGTTTEEENSQFTTSDNSDDATAPQFSITAGTVEGSEGSGTTGSTGGAGDSSENYGLAADATDSGSALADITLDADSVTSYTAPAAKEQPITSKGFADETERVLTFREIFLSEPERAEYVTITDEVNNTVITLTEQSAILDFYSVMDKHQFKNSSDNTGTQNYTVEINNPDVNAIYQMTIGTYITVSYTDADNSSQSYYNAVDADLLNQDLKDLVKKYSN